MEQEKFGKFIKEIRKKHNLTQKQLADKYHVTYQAVSKWENGKNMPDTVLMKQMSKDFNVSLDDMFDGEIKLEKKDYSKYIIIGLITLIVIVVGVFLFFVIKNRDFN